MVARRRQLETIIALLLAGIALVIVAVIGRYASTHFIEILGAISIILWVIARAL